MSLPALLPLPLLALALGPNPFPADLDTGPAAGGGERGSRGDDRPRDGEQFRGRDVREGELEDDLPGDEARGRTPVGRLGAGRGLPARE